MFLSIIIPVYNGGKYLSECLDSCLDQDIPTDDYEIICVDDESTDGSWEVVQEYANNHGNIIAKQKTHGIGDGRNIGLEMAQGDYVWFVDDDDLVASNCLGLFKKELICKPCDRLVLNCYRFFEELSQKEKDSIKNGQLAPNGKENGTQHNVVWTSILRRKTLIEKDIWPRDKRFAGRQAPTLDSYFIQRIRDSGIKEAFLGGKPFYFYRMHNGQSISDFSEATQKSRIEGMITLASIAKEDYDKELAEEGSVSFKTAMSLVVTVRGSMLNISNYRYKLRRFGIKRFREERFYPMKLPEVYKSNYSAWDCVKAKNGMLPLKSVAFYYSINPFGYTLYQIIDVKTHLKRAREHSVLLNKVIRRISK